MIASISQIPDGIRGQEIGTLNSKKYTGQTVFLTSKAQLEKDNLVHKTIVHFQPLKALMVMTDGVANDYFPATQGIQRLYGDLLLNDIISFPPASQQEMLAGMKETNIHTWAGIEEAGEMFISTLTRLIPPEEELKEVPVASFQKYAKVLGREELDVLNSNALLTSGWRLSKRWRGDDNNMRIPAERLRVWLDSCTVKASFKDRTLVVLHIM